jgi:hypothetical protein
MGDGKEKIEDDRMFEKGILWWFKSGIIWGVKYESRNEYQRWAGGNDH